MNEERKWGEPTYTYSKAKAFWRGAEDALGAVGTQRDQGEVIGLEHSP